MKAIAYRKSLPIDNAHALEDIELPQPKPEAHDVLVRVKAIAVNPVDVKVRANMPPAEGDARVLGWDAVGIVEGLGSTASKFKIGDRVYYAGALNRPGANSELHVVDERIAALAPKTLSDSQAAALPLTTITAYELLFDRLRVAKDGGAGQTLMIVGASGGVGSILIQLARQLTQLRIVATASREETKQWCLDLGAHVVIDHAKPLSAELKKAGIDAVDYVAGLTQTPQHFAEIVESLKPQGHLALIDDMDALDVMKLKQKSIALHWEFMYTRSMFNTPDMAEQGKLLAEVAALVDAGSIKTTATGNFGNINAANLREAHKLIESGKAKGKIVLEGF